MSHSCREGQSEVDRLRSEVALLTALNHLLANAIKKHRQMTRLNTPFEETHHDRELWAGLPMERKDD